MGKRRKYYFENDPLERYVYKKDYKWHMIHDKHTDYSDVSNWSYSFSHHYGEYTSQDLLYITMSNGDTFKGHIERVDFRGNSPDYIIFAGTSLRRYQLYQHGISLKCSSIEYIEKKGIFKAE